MINQTDGCYTGQMADTEHHLVQLYRQLGAVDRASLLAFAEFLGSRNAERPVPAGSPPTVIPAPEAIERPPGESVVAGLKRLARTYPMLDKSEMLSATSDLVATHIMRGSDPAVVIDELEDIFRAHYEQLHAAGGE